MSEVSEMDLALVALSLNLKYVVIKDAPGDETANGDERRERFWWWIGRWMWLHGNVLIIVVAITLVLDTHTDIGCFRTNGQSVRPAIFKCA